MPIVEAFEPALCCATGVCGPDVDEALVRFSSDLEWVRSQGGDARRYNLASEPTAFAENESVRGFLQVAGSDGLPLVLVDGVTVLTGAYPSREQLAAWTGVAAGVAGTGRSAELSREPTGDGTGCCSGDSRASNCC